MRFLITLGFLGILACRYEIPVLEERKRCNTFCQKAGGYYAKTEIPKYREKVIRCTCEFYRMNDWPNIEKPTYSGLSFGSPDCSQCSHCWQAR